MIDLYAGLGGWAEGGLAEGYRVVGFDCERHVYGEAQYPAQLVLQDVLTIHGAQFASAALIVASPPCQEFSYMAMPWSKAKEKAAALRDGRDDPKRLTALFDACFRIQREASEAAGRYIPLVVENVCGAQKWVGRARWHFGSFYLWGDVPALMPMTKRAKVGGFSWSDFGKPDYKAKAFNGEADRRLREEGVKNTGQRLEVGSAKFNRAGADGVKVASDNGRRTDIGKGARMTSRDCGDEAVKGVGIGSRSWAQGKGQRHPNDPRNFYSKTSDRKAASAQIAKIPLVLARHIAKSWRPE